LSAVIPAGEVSESDIKRLERKGVKFGSSVTSMEHLQARLAATYTAKRDA